MAVEVETRTWHGVLSETDEMASDAATVDLLCMLAAYLKPTTVVEAGTYVGHAALAVANVLRQLGHGKIYTADVSDYFTTKTAHLPGAEKFAPFVSFYHGDFIDMLDTIEGPVDLAYIDASTVERPRLRWEHYTAAWQRLRPGGLVLIDDTAGDWTDAPAFQDIADLQLMGRRGLSIIQKGM